MVVYRLRNHYLAIKKLSNNQKLKNYSKRLNQVLNYEVKIKIMNKV